MSDRFQCPYGHWLDSHVVGTEGTFECSECNAKAGAAPSLDTSDKCAHREYFYNCDICEGVPFSPKADAARIREIRLRAAGEVASLDYERWYGEDIPYLLAEVERREKQWRSWGVVEVATRNQSVADHCKHWEERTEKAESELANAQREIYCCDDVRLDQGLTVAISDLQRAREAAESSLASALQERDAAMNKREAAIIQANTWERECNAAEAKIRDMEAAQPMPEKGEL